MKCPKFSSMGAFRKLRDKLKGNKRSQPLRNPTGSPASASTADAVQNPTQPTKRESQAEEPHPKDLWEAAYQELSDKDRRVLSQIRVTRKPTSLCASEHDGEMLNLVDKVIESTVLSPFWTYSVMKLISVIIWKTFIPFSMCQVVPNPRNQLDCFICHFANFLFLHTMHIQWTRKWYT